MSPALPAWTLEPLAGEQQRVRFRAMASPCELLIDDGDPALGAHLAQIASDEALRVERKWSRYRDDNLVHAINSAGGATVKVDAETAGLIDFGATLHALSDGRFDLSAGGLRALWRFDGTEHWPAPEAVTEALKTVGWSRAEWDGRRLRLPPGMALDFGGIGKEYAVDRTLMLLREHTTAPLLVNYGGDLIASGPQRDGRPWRIGIDAGASAASAPTIQLRSGGVATSGDAHRYGFHGGWRYSHILDARNAYPVADAPRAVTVAADTCSAAGALSTLAMLQGAEAETFLIARSADYHVQR